MDFSISPKRPDKPSATRIVQNISAFKAIIYKKSTIFEKDLKLTFEGSLHSIFARNAVLIAF